jgi:DNA-binding LacI/PurR family transcriptional regulator
LSERDHQMLLLIVDGEASEKRVIAYVSAGAVDGAIVALSRPDEPVALALARSHIPLVTASGPLVGADVPMVDTDNLGGSESITRMLGNTGRVIIGEIRGPAASPVTALRHEGFRLAMSQRYNGDLVADAVDWSVEAGRSAAAELLRRAPSLQGIVAASDTLAAGAVSALVGAGRRVPADVAVVGFDDSPWATMTSPHLSTVRQEPRLTGARLADVVLRQLGGENLGNLAEILPNRIVWRDSAGPLPTTATARSEE